MISVIIPTYNEAGNIAPLLERIDSIIEEEYEALVIDDDSEDRTVEEARSTGLDSLKVIERQSRKGIGSAYKEGFSAAKGEIIVHLDADFSHPVEKIPELVDAINEGHDIAIGSRYVDNGKRKDPLYRRVQALVGVYLYVHLLGSPVQDITSGFRAYKREVALKLLENDLPDGFHFLPASLMSLDCDVVGVPIEFLPRRSGNSKYSLGDLLDNIVLLTFLLTEDMFQRLRKVG